MKHLLLYRHLAATMFGICFCLLLLARCTGTSKEQDKKIAKDSVGYVGSASCEGCHKDIYSSHINTAHYLTSRPATEQFIKGSFREGENTYAFNKTVSVVMQKQDSNFYQVAYVDGKEEKRKKFDVVVGSGTKGQTYLYWQGDKLFQLPIFYFAEKDEWANSPGYSGKLIFNRPITSRCLECHSTYAQKLNASEEMPEPFARATMVLGVDCEKCHGPAANHVAFHQKNPTDSIGRNILNPAKFSRQQKLDMCAVCHGGRLNKIKPSFSFQSGDTLENYFSRNSTAPDAASIDVHGNQLGLLAVSKCFLSSDMTCNNCHNSHANEAGKTALFSTRCMNCHSESHGKQCRLSPAIGSAIKQNCIDCHMPVQSSKAIVFMEQGSDVPVAATMRSHYIKIYPEEAKKILAIIKRNKDK